MIIGLTGTFAAGKDTVAEYLQEKGFEHFSCGDEIRAIAKERGMEGDRDAQRRLGNELRDEFGPAYLAERIMKKTTKPNVVIAGIRQPAEIKYLKSHDNFYLIAIDAPIEIRFKRMQERNRAGDPQTVDELVEKEKKEMESIGKNAQKIHECMEMADVVVVNDGDLVYLDKQIDKILKEKGGFRIEQKPK